MIVPFFYSEFLGIALGLLDECYRTNEDVAQQLLTYNLDNWGDQCCLSLAVATGHEEFVAHPCCQTLLTEIWMGAMKMSEWCSVKVKVGVPCPPSLTTEIKPELLAWFSNCSTRDILFIKFYSMSTIEKRESPSNCDQVNGKIGASFLDQSQKKGSLQGLTVLAL